MKWTDLLSQEALDLSRKLEQRALDERNNGKNICPPQDQIFRALQLTPPDKVKVCIVGQDPYHTPGQANGLAFSIANGNPLQPSLVNIFKELNSDLGIPRPAGGDLTKWAEQGVLLLNTSLTVYEHQANSHENWGWKNFTREILSASMQLPRPIVYMGWGANAIDILISARLNSPIVYKGDIAIQKMTKKAFLFSSHPSPFSCRKKCRNYPPFMGNKPFSKANQILEEMGGEAVDWRL